MGGDTSPSQVAAETSDSPRAKFYRERLREFTRNAEELAARSARVSNLRGASFGIAAIAGVWAIFGSGGLWVGTAGALAACFFAYFVWRHARVIRDEDLALRWVAVNREALYRARGEWKKLSDDGATFSNPVHPYAGDLDLFGGGSLFQRVSMARTSFGRARLASFLMNRADLPVATERQVAARELAPKLQFRQELEALAWTDVPPLPGGERAVAVRPKRSTSKAPDLDGLLAWAESDVQFMTNRPLVLAAWLLPSLTCVAAVSAWVLQLHPVVWLLPVVLSAIVLLTARPHVGAVFAAVSGSRGAFLRFGPMLHLVEQLPVEATRLAELKRALCSIEGAPPSRVMRDFERIVGYFDLRHNGMVYPFINALLLWDVHCILRLEAWQRRAGKQLRGWFHALGELEALSSLAGLADDNPEYCWPELVSEPAAFEAVGLGHPLIAAEHRVSNDVSLGGQVTALLVTGSNMSGKSTLLRAMGTNIALALAGGPVCATSLRMSPVALRSSMRISDSLEAGVSHFYAEVQKLKAVLDSLQGDVPVFFLLDEILHGTNSRERQIGARWVLAQLVRAGALGAVSTHDSGLCELSAELTPRVRQVHLRETVVGDAMTFDYRLHPGPVQSGNALRLMRISGIDVPLE